MTAAIGKAVVGAGCWGPKVVRSAMATPSFHLRWLCDLDDERARRVLGGCTIVSATEFLEAILDDEVPGGLRHARAGLVGLPSSRTASIA